MSSITVNNIDAYLNQFKFNLNKFECDCDVIESDVSNCEKEIAKVKERSEALVKRMQEDSVVLTSWSNVSDIVEPDNFSNVMRRIQEMMREMRKRMEALLERQTSGDDKEERRLNFKPRTVHLNTQVLNSRQTKQQFIFLVMKPNKNLSCNTCKEPILIYSPYLEHLEEYPTGSKTMRRQYYHIKVQCFFVRGFEVKYLSDAKVICENEISEALIETFQEIGFSSENIQNKDDSDCESDESEAMSQTSGASREPTISQFIYKRKNNSLNEIVSCCTCRKNIVPDSYLIRGNNTQSYHIRKDCIQSEEVGSIDFSKTKCKVYKLLRNHNELKQLLSCGFYYNKIIGFRPQNPNPKGFVRQGGDEPRKIYNFFFKRDEGQHNKIIICVGCKKRIYNHIYLLRGNSREQPFHIKRKCIHSGELGVNEIGRTQCIVNKLLRNHCELKQLWECGFCNNNIIGDRPSNPEFKINSAQTTTKDTIVKDIGFIFNEEIFSCIRLIQEERCEGCSQFVKKDELCFRHKERIPREKLLESPLVSQFYHTTKDCLLKRGFTEKFLEYSKCNISVNKGENVQRIKDMVVRCGFSSDNLIVNICQEVQTSSVEPPKSVQKDSQQLYLYVFTCTNMFTYCAGCNSNIESKSVCFKYEDCIIWDNTQYFHIRGDCLRKNFTDAQMLSITCINNDSMADISVDDISKCGIKHTEQRQPCKAKKGNRKGNVSFKCNPLKLNKLRFIVDVVMDNQDLCSACKKHLQLDKYVLKAVYNDSLPPVKMHLDAGCVRKCGYYPTQLSECELSLEVYISVVGREKLEECGFRNIPNTR